MKQYIMAIDAGTTSARCILFDRQGTMCAVTQQELHVRYPQDGWVEQDAMEIWTVQLAVCRQALQKLGIQPEQIAAIIVEPVAANMGVVPPAEGFLQGLRDLCTKHGVVLIFDEVITGFRLAAGGAQEYFGIQADLVTFGKIIGGGMPVGAYGGKKEIMSVISPLGPVYQAGTLSGNPIAMAAGIEMLTILKENPSIYTGIRETGEYLFNGIQAILDETGAPCTMNHVSSLGNIFFTPDPVVDYTSAQKSDTAAFGRYFHYMLDNGVHLGPSQFEAMFVSAAHTREDIDQTLELIRKYFTK